MPNPNAPGQQKHKLHDALERHVTDWAAPFGVTFQKHEIDEIIRAEHVRGSLDLLASPGTADVTRLRQALAFTGGMADFFLQAGATDPLVAATVDAMKQLLS